MLREEWVPTPFCVQNILERFGIDSEAEIFSGCYSVIRKQFGDKEDDDMSFYNTKRVLEVCLSYKMKIELC